MAESPKGSKVSVEGSTSGIRMPPLRFSKCPKGIHKVVTAPFNNMRNLKFEAQPINAFFATVNQMFCGSSQLPTTAERAVIKSLSTVQTTRQCSAVAGRREEPPNV